MNFESIDVTVNRAASVKHNFAAEQGCEFGIKNLCKTLILALLESFIWKQHNWTFGLLLGSRCELLKYPRFLLYATERSSMTMMTFPIHTKASLTRNKLKKYFNIHILWHELIAQIKSFHGKNFLFFFLTSFHSLNRTSENHREKLW